MKLRRNQQGIGHTAGFFLLAVLTIIGLVGWRVFNAENNKADNSTSQSASTGTEVKFTARIFDPAKVKNIIPLGELNGGYIETQTINGATINNKSDANGQAYEIEIFAPTDMTLVNYSYYTASDDPSNRHLGFRISDEVMLSFDHITWVPDKIREVTPATSNSSFFPPTKKLSFKAGDLIAKTTGTALAHNWNIYATDSRQRNVFVNQERYDKIKDSYGYVYAVCPFSYHEESIEQEFIALMGWSAPGQSKTCGTNSRDVKGSISGMWHLSKDGVREDYQGAFASPFSVYKLSSNEIVLYEINRQRYILDSRNSTHKDPAVVTTEHCYALTKFGGSETPIGYAYFKVISNTEMQLAYSQSGNCPNSFPGSGAKTYYR